MKAVTSSQSCSDQSEYFFPVFKHSDVDQINQAEIKTVIICTHHCDIKHCLPETPCFPTHLQGRVTCAAT